MREKIRVALERYRDVFRPLAEQLLVEDPEALGGGTADGLAAVAVSFVQGCAVQAIMDPDHFDVEESMTAVHALIARPVAVV